MVECKCAASVNLHFDERLIAVRKPKTLNPLVFPDEVGPINPERRFLSRMTRDFRDREVLRIDPYFPLEEILVISLWSGLKDETVVRAQVLLRDHFERVV